MNVDDLLELPFDDFKKLVEREFRDQLDPDEKEVGGLLRSEEVVERWYGALSAMLRSIDGQLATQYADMKGRVAHHQRKLDLATEALDALLVNLSQKHTLSEADARDEAQARAKVRGRLAELSTAKQRFWDDRVKKLRFRNGVDTAFAEAKVVRTLLTPAAARDVVVQERNELAQRVRDLEGAIRTHRALVLSPDHHPDLSDDEVDDQLWEWVV